MIVERGELSFTMHQKGNEWHVSIHVNGKHVRVWKHNNYRAASNQLRSWLGWQQT